MGITKIPLILALLFITVCANAQTRYVTVIAENANLRGTPSATGAVIAKVSEGDVLKLVEQRGAWFLVETPKYVGWLHGNTVRMGRASSPQPNRGIGTGTSPWRRCKLPDMDVYGTCPDDVVPTFLPSDRDRGYDIAIVGENKVKDPILWERPEQARDSSLCAVRVGEDPAVCHRGEIESLSKNTFLVILDRTREKNFLNVVNLKSGNSGWIYVGHLEGIYYTRNPKSSVPTFREQRTGSYGNPELRIKNDTDRLLSLTIGGSQYTIPAYESRSITVTAGTYKFYAWVPNAYPLMGEKYWTNGIIYSWTFYIGRAR